MSDEKLLNFSEYLTVDELLALPTFQHLKPTTLAKWRQQGYGPEFVVIGRKVFYPRAAVRAYLLKEQRKHEFTREIGTLALSIQAEGPLLRRHHRLGRHKTKQECSESSRGTETIRD